jgi:hypothetical protein
MKQCLQVEAANPIQPSVRFATVALRQPHQVGFELRQFLLVEQQAAATASVLVEAVLEELEVVVDKVGTREESTGSAQDRSAAFRH